MAFAWLSDAPELSAASTTRARGHLTDLTLLLVGSGAFLVAVILWLDNAQAGLTGNGVYKSLELKAWIADPAHAPLYPSNYFFYPAYGALCRVLDLFGVFAGDPRRQLTILNAASAALCLGVVYLLVRALTGDRRVAWITALFHLASSYVLMLAISNEDIMPSYTITFAAMALAGVWFAKPTAARVIVVSALFSIGWLFEWRLMFPTLPALLAALWLCERRPAARFGWIALLLATMVATASVAAWAWRGHAGAVGPLELLWTGKGVHSSWAGFSWAKIGYLSDGGAGYLLGTAITRIEAIPGWDAWRYAALAAMLAIAGVALPMLWRQRYDSRSRALIAVFGGTFVAGEVFNLYSQPQDPQMQINVMAWLTVGWALVLVAARDRWGRRGLAALAGLTMALLAYNILSLAPLRGRDTAWQRSLDNIERRADPARTVFLLHDFDWMKVYASLYWGLEESGADTLGPSPQKLPKFKWIGFAYQLLQHPEWSTEQHVADLRRQIDHALELGYDVQAVRVWRMELPKLSDDTAMVADRHWLSEMRAMLHRDYVAVATFDDPTIGAIDRLQRKIGR